MPWLTSVAWTIWFPHYFTQSCIRIHTQASIYTWLKKQNYIVINLKASVNHKQVPSNSTRVGFSSHSMKHYSSSVAHRSHEALVMSYSQCITLRKIYGRELKTELMTASCSINISNCNLPWLKKLVHWHPQAIMRVGSMFKNCMCQRSCT